MAETALGDEPDLFSQAIAQPDNEDLSFEHFCELYPENRHGGNADEAAELWNTLADGEKRNAISHTIAANANNRY